MKPSGLITLLFSVFASVASAEDWPRWRGPRGDGTWQAPANVAKIFPDNGPRVVWRAKIGGGYSGVTVAEGRAYLMDRDKAKGTERILCFAATDGALLWQHGYAANYAGLDYDNGPRAAVTIHDGLAYAFGAVGHLHCLDAATGQVRWHHDTVKSLGAKQPTWGFASSPVIHGERVLCHLGIPAGGSYVAFDRKTGQEIWRSLADPAGYCTPVIIQHEGQEQMIAWTPEHIRGLRPTTGQPLWAIPFKVTYGVAIATPIFHQGILLVNEYWKGSKAIALTGEQAEILWEKDELCGLMGQALYREGHVYMLDKAKGLTCYELKTGTVRWRDEKHTLTPADVHPHLSLAQIAGTDRVMILNSNGELISARLTSEKFEELSRAQLLDKTWADPAYVDGRIFARSDRQLVCADLTLTP